jgi:hypothetical protein
VFGIAAGLYVLQSVFGVFADRPVSYRGAIYLD